MSYIFKLKICFQRNLPSFRFRDINVLYSLFFFFYFIISLIKNRRFKRKENKKRGNKK